MKPTPIQQTLGMRLSCDFVNVYTIAYRVQYTFTRVHARIPNGHPREDPREEKRACRISRRTSRRGCPCRCRCRSCGIPAYAISTTTVTYRQCRGTPVHRVLAYTTILNSCAVILSVLLSYSTDCRRRSPIVVLQMHPAISLIVVFWYTYLCVSLCQHGWSIHTTAWLCINPFPFAGGLA